MDKFGIGLIVFFVVFFVVAIYSSIKYEEKAEVQAKAMGCEYLGSARGMNSVVFYACGDAIVLKKIN